MEILWVHDKPGEGLDAVRSLAKSLDDYEIALDINEPDGQFVAITPNGAKSLSSESGATFRCPHCGGGRFSVLNGHHQGSPLVGLHCSNCETFGLVFPNGTNAVT